MTDLDIQAMRLRYLQRIYELSGGSTIQGVPISKIDSDFRISDEDDPKIVTYLTAKGLANYSTFGHVSITARGIDEAERAMQSSYAQKERRVLQRIYEMGGVRHTDWVSIDALVRDLGMDFREVNDILIDLEERKGLINGVEEAVRIIPAGIEALEGGRRDAGAAPKVSYTTNIQGPNYGGIQQGGEKNVQNITLTNNPDFDNAINSLVELIRTSSMPCDDKTEIQDELSKVNTLALREPTAGLLERAKTRLDVVKLAIAGTDVAIKAAPHLATLWDILRLKLGG